METQTIGVFTNLILLVFLLVFLAATTSTGSTIYGLSLTIALILCFLKSFGGLVADKRPPSFPSRCRYVVISNHPGLTAQVTSAHPPALHLMPQLMNRWPKTLKLFPIHPSIHYIYTHQIMYPPIQLLYSHPPYTHHTPTHNPTFSPFHSPNSDEKGNWEQFGSHCYFWSKVDFSSLAIFIHILFTPASV